LNTILKGIDKSLTVIEAITDYLAAAAMFLTMVIVCGEVAARYIVNAPLAWAFDVLTLYVVPAIFFFGLPGSYSKNAHIAVDILVQKLAPLPVAITVLVGRFGGIALFLALAWFGAGFALETYRNGDTNTGVLTFLIWPSAILIPIGCGLVLLRMLSQLPEDFMAVAKGGREPGHVLERSYVE